MKNKSHAGVKPVVASRHVGTYIPEEDHRELKGRLAAEGQSIKDWIYKCVEEKLGHPLADILRVRGALHTPVERGEPWTG